MSSPVSKPVANASRPPLPTESASAQKSADAIDYEVMADAVGFVPSLRKWDTIIQTIFILTVSAIAAIVGSVKGGGAGIAIGLLVGLAGSFLVSGTVLMILGWVRTAKKLAGRK